MTASGGPAGRAGTSWGDGADGPAPPAQPAFPGYLRESTVVVRRVDPWSVLRVAFAWSVVLMVVGLVAVVALYAILAGMGVFQSVNDVLAEVTGGGRFVLPGLGSVFAIALVLGFVDVVLLTALSTLGALIYNAIAALVGGVEVTLADAE